MATSQTDCLLNAVRAIRGNPNIDPEDADLIVDGLESTISRQYDNTDAQLQRALLRMRDANRDVADAAVKKLVREKKEIELAQKFENPEIPVEETAVAWQNYIEFNGRLAKAKDFHLSGHVRQEVARAQGALFEVWENVTRRRFGVSYDSEFAKTFNAQLWGVNTGDPLARELVQKFRDVVLPLLARARANGINVGAEDNWGFITHNQGRISSDIPGWERFMEERLDPRYHPDARASMEHIQQTLRRRGVVDEPKARLGSARQVFFKAPEDYVEYQLRFGDKGFGQGLFQVVTDLAQTVAVAERLTPSPLATVRKVSLSIKQRVRDELEVLAKQRQVAEARAEELTAEGKVDEAQAALAKAAEASRRAKTLADLGKGGIAFSTLDAPEMMTKGLLGEFSSPENQTFADWMAGLRNWGRALLLGRTALWMLTEDHKNILMRIGPQVEGQAGGRLNFYRQLAAVMSDDQAREFAQSVGFYQAGIGINQSYRQAGIYDDIAGAAQGPALGAGLSGQAAARFREGTARAATAVRWMTGDMAIENNARGGLGLVVNNGFASQLRRKTWGALEGAYKKQLEANGFTADLWQRLQRVAEYREEAVGGGLELNALPPDLYPIVMSYMWREIDMAVVYPGLYTRAVLTRDTRPGSIQGELVRNTAMFWSYPTEFYRSTWRNEIMKGTTPAVAFAAASVGAAILSTQLAEILNGRPPRAADDPVMWATAITRSGLLGPLGEVAYQTASPVAAGSPIEGAPFGILAEGVGGIVGAGLDTMDGETDRAAAKLVRTVDNTLLPNAWWLDGLIIHPVVESTLDNLEPGRARRRERRFAREGR